MIARVCAVVALAAGMAVGAVALGQSAGAAPALPAPTTTSVTVTTAVPTSTAAPTTATSTAAPTTAASSTTSAAPRIDFGKSCDGATTDIAAVAQPGSGLAPYTDYTLSAVGYPSATDTEETDPTGAAYFTLEFTPAYRSRVSLVVTRAGTRVAGASFTESCQGAASASASASSTAAPLAVTGSGRVTDELALAALLLVGGTGALAAARRRPRATHRH